MLYGNLIVSTKKKLILLINTQKKMRKKSNTKENHQKNQGKREREEKNREELQKWPEKTNKMTVSQLLLFSHSVTANCFATPQTVACQATLSMEFSRQVYWSRLPFSLSEDLPNPGLEPTSPCLLHCRRILYQGVERGEFLCVIIAHRCTIVLTKL